MRRYVYNMCPSMRAEMCMNLRYAKSLVVLSGGASTFCLARMVVVSNVSTLGSGLCFGDTLPLRFPACVHLYTHTGVCIVY